MRKLIIFIFLFLIPNIVFGSETDPSYALNNAHRLSVAINDAFINGFSSSGVEVYINVLSICAAVFFLIRSFLEYNNGSITINDLIFTKFLFILFVFTIIDPVLYFSLINIVKNTAFELGDALQTIFTGTPDFYHILGNTFYIMFNVNPVTDSLSFTEIALISLLLMVATFFLYKQLLHAVIGILFFYIFSFISYNILGIVGLFILPLVFIKELSFVVNGFGKALMFLFIFTIAWKLIVSIALFLLYTALYGVTFVNRIKQGMTVYDFIGQQIHLIMQGQSVSLYISGPLDLIVPISFLAIAIILISLTFQISQLIMTGFFSFKVNFI